MGNGYIDGLRNIDTAEALPRFMSDASLNHLTRLVKPLGDPSAEYFEAAWGLNGASNSIRVTNRAQRNLTELRMSRMKSIGSITGVLDALSIRSGNKFQIYDDVSERPVTAEFRREDLERVKDAIGERVNVSGLIFRNSKGQPIRIDEPRFDIMKAERPISSIIGIAPDFLGEMTMREYMEYVG